MERLINNSDPMGELVFTQIKASDVPASTRNSGQESKYGKKLIEIWEKALPGYWVEIQPKQNGLLSNKERYEWFNKTIAGFRSASFRRDLNKRVKVRSRGLKIFVEVL